jgi:cell envelope-related function transcriptional attenuator common domain
VRRRRFGLVSALALTLGSAVFWGLAHACMGRIRAALGLLIAQATIVATVLMGVTVLRYRLLPLAVRPGWLMGLIVGTILVAAIWVAVVIWSYRAVRPTGVGGARNVIAGVAVGLLCVLVIAPFAYASRLAYVSRDVLTTLFGQGDGAVSWQGRSRVTFLLIGADAGKDRYGARTDSMTVASVDTRTGHTVLFGLPRNLQRVPLPPGPARQAFPFGFTGDGSALTPGLLNEVYQWAEDHPSIVPGVPRGHRGIKLLKETVAGILGVPIDYYAMVDMKGFAALVDAVGGVTITVAHDIPYGQQGAVLRAGTRRLSGREALWYGRSRTDSDDYVRMARQKCLLNALVKQADPATVLRGFEEIAEATKRYVSTDLPGDLLPTLVELADRARRTQIESLQFVPPLINTAAPDWSLIRRKVATALADRPRHAAASPAPAPNTGPRANPSADGAIRLDSACG